MLFTRSGGHKLAHAPAQELIAPASFSNRYRVRPLESTSTEPTPVLATLTVAFGSAALLLLVPLPPQAARASADSDIAAAPAREVRNLVRVMAQTANPSTSTCITPAMSCVSTWSLPAPVLTDRVS